MSFRRALSYLHLDMAAPMPNDPLGGEIMGSKMNDDPIPPPPTGDTRVPF